MAYFGTTPPHPTTILKPTFVAQRNEGTATAGEGTQGIYEGDDDWYNIAEQVKVAWDYEDANYRVYQERHDRCSELFNLTYDSSDGKEDWQSKVKYPFMSSLVERYVAAISQMIDKSSSWFDIESKGAPQSKVHANAVKDLILMIAEDKDSDFRTAANRLSRFGLLSGNVNVMPLYVNMDGVPLKSRAGIEEGGGLPMGDFIPNPDPVGAKSKPFIVNSNRPKLKIEVMSSSNVRRDSSETQRYVMWKSMISPGQLRKNAAVFGFDPDQVEQVIHNSSGNLISTTARKTLETGEQQTAGPFRKKIELLHFEGTLEDNATGDIIFENKYCVVANNILLAEPVEIPHWDNSLSVISAPFIETPGSVFGWSPLTHAVDMMFERSEMLNSFNDYLYLAMRAPVLIDEDALSQEEPLLTEGHPTLYPGRVIRINSSGNRTDPVRLASVGELPASAWQHLQLFQSTVQELTGADQDNMGMPRTRGRTTARESQSREAMGSQWISNIFTELDKKCLSPLLKQMMLRTLQYMPDDEWEAHILARKASILPNTDKSPPEVIKQWNDDLVALSKMNAQQRYQELGGKYDFKVNLFNSPMVRQMQIENMQFLSKASQADPRFSQAINYSELVRQFVTSMGMDPELWLNKAALPSPDPITGEPMPEPPGQPPMGNLPNVGPPNMTATPPPQLPQIG